MKATHYKNSKKSRRMSLCSIAKSMVTAFTLLLCVPFSAYCQINTDRMMTIARNALAFETERKAKAAAAKQAVTAEEKTDDQT